MLLQQLANGVMLGNTYALVAIGYTLIFGVLRLLHLAHGEVFMVGAFAGLQIVLLSTGGASGMGGIRPLTELWQVTVVTGVALLMVWRIRHVRFGRAMVAIHEDDVAAEAMGINLTRTK